MAVIQVVGDWTHEKRLIGARVSKAVSGFLALGVSAITRACNARRASLLRDLPAMLPSLGLADMPLEEARFELDCPFDLRNPGRVTIDMTKDQSTSDPARPMETLGEKIWVFVSRADDPRLTGISLTLETCTYHEMIHLCGDNDSRMDGLLRIHHAGVVVVEELLRGMEGSRDHQAGPGQA